MSPPKQAKLHDFLAAAGLAVVSSISPEGTSQSAVVGIAVTPDLEIIFDTLGDSRKYRNLKAHPECSVVAWRGEITAQLEGIAEEPSGADLARYTDVYFKKFPDGVDRRSWPGIRYFVVRPKWIRYSDYDARPAIIQEFSL